MQKEERKNQILDCAKKLFAIHGYFNTQISDIINEANIARGTFYRYFTNKKDIFITLLENYYNAWETEISLERDNLDLKTIDPREYFRYRIKKTFQFFAKDKYLCKITLRMGLGLPHDMEVKIKKFEERIVNLVMKDLKLGINNNHVKPDIDLELTANLIVGAMLRLAYFYFGREEGDETVDLEKMTNEVAEIVSPGLFFALNA